MALLKKIRRLIDPATIVQAVFADVAASLRVAEAGMDLQILGELSTAERVGESTPVVVFNSDSAVHYVAFGDQTVAAPTGPSDGIPIAGGEKYVVNSGSKAWIRSDSALVFGYVADKD